MTTQYDPPRKATPAEGAAIRVEAHTLIHTMIERMAQECQFAPATVLPLVISDLAIRLHEATGGGVAAFLRATAEAIEAGNDPAARDAAAEAMVNAQIGIANCAALRRATSGGRA